MSALIKPTLTTEQLTVIQKLTKGYCENKSIQTLGGYAGSGKTEVIHTLAMILPDAAVCAFTGKAASILKRKGVDATTIHSLIYNAFWDEEAEEMRYSLSKGVACTGIIVDEASMVTTKLYKDLIKFNLPIIFVGDHGQLPPVGGDPGLMINPDYKLTKIHRNAGEISRFAEWVRLGRNPYAFPLEPTNMVEFIPRQQVMNRKLLSCVDQVICAYNKTRVSINKSIRISEGLSGKLLCDGERVMCLRNNREYDLHNGMQGTVSRVRLHGKNPGFFNFRYDNKIYQNIPFDPCQFGKTYTLPFANEYGEPSKIPLFDYANAATAHKCQGDQFDDVLIIDPGVRHRDYTRWLYTAVSRAIKKVYLTPGKLH